MTIVFETELIGIDGVEAPTSIVTKAAPEATSTSTGPVEAATQNIVDTIKGKINEVASLVKSLITDQDGVEEKAEL